jgi:hypothetical protein
VTIDEALKLARDHGVRVTLDGNCLAFEADAPPPQGLLAILGRGKCAALRLREVEDVVASCIGSTTTSPRRLPESGPIAAAGHDRKTLSSCCSSETTGERCTDHVIPRGLRSKNLKRGERSG